MRSLLITLALLAGAIALQAQNPNSAVFPAAVAQDTDLSVACNNAITTLSAPITNSQLTIPVVSTVGFCYPTFVSLGTTGSEIVSVCSQTAGNQLNVCAGGRGAQGTTANAFNALAIVSANVTAWTHNQTAAEIKAVESFLGPAGANLSSFIPFIDPRKYNFSLTNGSGVSGTLSGPGSQTLTLTKGPLGVSGTDANHYLYVSGGTGTAEAVLITGGSCTPGTANCTLIITTANAHTGAWTLSSATSGIAEVAAFTVANGNQAAVLPAGSFTIHAPVYWPAVNGLYLLGQGTQATLLNVAADFPMSAPCVLNVVQNASYVSTSGVEGLSIKFIQPDSAGPYTQWPPAILFSSNHTVLRDLEIIGAWNGIVADTALSQGAGSAFIDHVSTSAFHHGMELDELYDTTYISHYRSWPVGLTTAQLNQFLNPAQLNLALYVGRVDDLQITDFNSESACAIFYLSGTGSGGAPGGGTSGHINGMWCDQGGFTMNAGSLRINNAHFGAGADVTLLGWFGGQLLVTNSTFVNSGTGLTKDLVEANAQTTASSFGPSTIQISNSYFNSFGNNVHSIFCNDGQATTTNSFCTVTNNFFYRSPNVAYTAPTISVIDGASGFARLTAMDNTASDIGSGSGNFIAVGSDDYHQLGPNNINGYTYFIPANAVKTAVSPPLKVTFAALGTVPPAGYERYCTDCATGAICAGSGSGHKAVSNGTNWGCQ